MKAANKNDTNLYKYSVITRIFGIVSFSGKHTSYISGT